jgi:hypothetical protein
MTASMPQYIPPVSMAPTFGPPTRNESAVQAAIARGFGGRVTDEEMAGQLPASAETDAPPSIARYGVPARIGGRIVFNGQPGRITGYSRENAHILVLLDGDTEAVPVHPTWHMTYLTADSTPKG